MENKNEKINKIVLAYSGGLDTSVSIKWLEEKYGAEIITFTADLGQNEDWVQIKEKALNTGAKKAHIMDLKNEFLTNYAFKGLKANALYEGKYPLATALARPLIAKKMVEVAREEGADALAHGCTGKGNDQVRFEVSFKALAPELEIIAPLRDWGFTTREEEIEYAAQNNIQVKATKDSPYSIDQNIWGLSVECGNLEDPWEEPPADAYQWTNDIENTPDDPTYLTIGFKKGKPISINGVEMNAVKLVNKLNKIGSNYGIGRIDMVEDRLVGIKSREIYETPAGEILLKAHRELESLTLDRETIQYKEDISKKYAELTYNGLWFSPLKDSLDAFINNTQKEVNGIVKLKLAKGNSIVVGRKSENSLYQYGLATYDEKDAFDHSSAPGFINLWALPVQVANQVKNSKNKKKIWSDDFNDLKITAKK
ncbi:MAG: argininosuccinate synthase [Bacillota bacterium]